MAVLTTMHTGKQPDVLCGIKIKDIYKAKPFEAKDGEKSYKFHVKPDCKYAVFKTVGISDVNVSEDLLSLLEQLAFLRLNID